MLQFVLHGCYIIHWHRFPGTPFALGLRFRAVTVTGRRTAGYAGCGAAVSTAVAAIDDQLRMHTKVEPLESDTILLTLVSSAPLALTRRAHC